MVLSGQFLIDSEASLKSAVSRLEAAAPTSAAPTHAGSEELWHHAQGNVVSMTSDRITIAHGPVPSLKWPAMTMAFQLPKRGLPKGLDEGEHVTFSFSQIPGGGYRIERIAAQDGKEQRQ